MKMNLKLILAITIVTISFNIQAQQYKNAQNTFVIVLDIQPYFTENAMSESQAQKLIDASNKVIENTEASNIIYVKTYHRMLTMSFKGIKIDTISNMEFDKNLNIVNENIFIKTKASAFSLNDLNDFLKEKNAERILVVGLMAEDCLYKTVLEGSEMGYEMFVIPESMGAKSQKSKEKVLKKLVKKGVNILYL